MIEVGKQVVSLREAFASPYLWSRFAWCLFYPDIDVILHALNSNLFVCSPDWRHRLVSGKLSYHETQILRESGLLLNSTQEDDELVNVVRQKVKTPNPLVTLFLIVTDNCNLRCTYCYEDLPRHSRNRTMSLTTMKTTIEKFLFVADKEAKIFFYGGEPLLCEAKIREAIKYVRTVLGNKEVELQITTNGTVYRPDLVDFMQQYKVGIAVSIDGPEDINNAMRVAKNRKLNVFQQAVALWRQCIAANLDCSILCTITEENAEQLPEICRFLLKELGAGKVNFNLKLKKPADSFQDQRLFWHHLAMEIAKAYFWMLKDGVMEGRILRYVTGLTEGTYSISECDAGYGAQIVVKPDGTIGPCQGFLYDPNYFVRKKDWWDIFHHPLWQTFIGTTPINLETCLSCPFIGTCGGGCHYNRLAFDQPNPNFCQFTRSLQYAIIQQLVHQP